MARKKPTWKMLSYGIHTNWEKGSKELPKLKKFSWEIPARLDIEFGYVLNIKQARGKKLEFTIEHPNFIDLKTGEIAPSFCGEIFVRSNDWDFFLGDTLWAPVEDKIGTWTLTTKLDGELLVKKRFTISPDNNLS
ncbi:DUF3859 domain-containing protein [Lentisphaera profundi]|uniref:DUF3859 domain-containing protein n=1 Tax=Lentisphaera profundi TaxID=1658616 RepID=A0ABY7VSD4_9BACT|nr:DUF3859 domain-containing protein [Lentisphaera profundi]WDE96130.1 DUF3859 domain-containing protein [Lentisphaera profundi]